MTTLPHRLVVTGASGNVGTALLRRLAREDVEVVAVCRRPPAAAAGPAGQAGPVRWFPLDLSAPDAARRLVPALAGAGAVVHLAWQIQPSHDEPAMEATNVGGTRAVLDAAVGAGVAHLVHVSSVGAYAAVPDPRRKEPVGEDWPTTGIPSSAYSRHKAAAEALLDAELARGGSDAVLGSGTAVSSGTVISRVRPGLVLQRDAGGEIARYFAGPLLPARLLGSPLLAGLVLPLPAAFTVPVVHADDLAGALVALLAARAPGAFNVAADDPLTPTDIATGLGARGAVDVPVAALRALAGATWRARLQPTASGWVDLAAGAPVMSTERARSELGWSPRTSARAALADLVAGMRDGAGAGTPPLVRRTALSGRRTPVG